jgi:transposase
MRESGSIAPQPMGGSKSPLDDDTREVLRWLVWSQPDATLRELLLRLEHETGVRTNDSTLSRVLKEMGLTRKKSRSSTIGGRIAT